LSTPSEQSPDRRPASTAAAGTVNDDPGVEASAAERVVFFSDAVVAIAITLLALALPVPRGTDSTTNGQLLDTLGKHWPEYFAFLISFVVIGNHWAAHRRTFRYAHRLNRQVTSVNMLWLLMMILTPFATRVLSGNGGFGVRFTLYALVQAIAAACLFLMNRELSRGDLLRPDAPASARHPDYVASLAIVAMFLVSIPVAFVTAWAFALWVAVPLLIRLVRRRLLGNGAARHE
jgi:uncharacterized membrane protein